MFKAILNLFFPKVCAGCDSFLQTNEKVICTLCRHHMPLTNQHTNPENEVFKKFYGRISVEHASALLYFHKKGMVQKLIHNLKYRGHQEIGTTIGKWYAEDLKKVTTIASAEVIIPVPLHRKKQRERGYNQVTTFGTAIANELHLTYDNTILFRKIYSKTQSKKNLLGRTEKIDDLFDVSFTERNHNKHYLLIDDVITTGATLEACCKALLKIPGTKISIICMAMAQ